MFPIANFPFVDYGREGEGIRVGLKTGYLCVCTPTPGEFLE